MINLFTNYTFSLKRVSSLLRNADESKISISCQEDNRDRGYLYSIPILMFQKITLLRMVYQF